MIITKEDKTKILEIIGWYVGFVPEDCVEDIILYLNGEGWDKNDY